MGEFELIERYFCQHDRHPEVILGEGDDCALFKANPQLPITAVTTDTLNEGVHFFKNEDPYFIGYKALLVNVSDLAAMGAKPAFFTLSLNLPEADPKWLERFAAGLFALASKVNMALIGGNTSRGPLSITISAYGQLPYDQALRRSGAKPGDGIFVTGTLGAAALFVDAVKGKIEVSKEVLSSLHKRAMLMPPRSDFAQEIRTLASAGIDISDGIIGDLKHILKCSHCAAKLELALLPTTFFLNKAKVPPLVQSLYGAYGGGDYELLLTIPPMKQRAVRTIAAEYGIKITQIGIICAGDDLDLYWQNSRLTEQEKKQPFEHFYSK